MCCHKFMMLKLSLSIHKGLLFSLHIVWDWLHAKVPAMVGLISGECSKLDNNFALWVCPLFTGHLFWYPDIVVGSSPMVSWFLPYASVFHLTFIYFNYSHSMSASIIFSQMVILKSDRYVSPSKESWFTFNTILYWKDIFCLIYIQ